VSDFNCQVLDIKGNQVETMDLNPIVFGYPINEQCVHFVIRQQLASRRAGTHSVLGRSAMKGGGKKPFKQKGTGHARQGSGISPLNPGGAILFGPSPRDYSFKVSKRVRSLALASALSDKFNSGNLRVVDSLNIESGKTRDMVEFLNAVKTEGKILIVLSRAEAGVLETFRASKNLSKVVVLPPEGVNVYDVVNSDYLVATKVAISALEARFE